MTFSNCYRNSWTENCFHPQRIENKDYMTIEEGNNFYWLQIYHMEVTSGNSPPWSIDPKR